MPVPYIVCLYLQGSAHAGAQLVRLYHRGGEKVDFLDIATPGQLGEGVLAGHAQARIPEHAAKFLHQGPLHAARDFCHGGIKGQPRLNAGAEKIQKIRQLPPQLPLPLSYQRAQEHHWHDSPQAHTEKQQGQLLGQLQLRVGYEHQCQAKPQEH